MKMNYRKNEVIIAAKIRELYRHNHEEPKKWLILQEMNGIVESTKNLKQKDCLFYKSCIIPVYWFVTN